jgi:four helix bundle protein
MSTHRTLEAWKEARYVSLGLLRVARDHWKPWFAAALHQVLRSSASVQVNIAEGSSFGLSRTYTRHLAIAYGSAIETIEFLDLLVESKAVPGGVMEDLLSHAQRTRQLLLGLLKYHRPRTNGQE